MQSAEFKFPLRVYVDATDAGGIVYHAHYLIYMEHARTEFLRTLGIPKPAVADNGKILVVASINVQYLQAARLDEELVVTAKLIKVARSYVIFEQEVRRGKETVLARGEVKIACVEKQTLKPRAFADNIQAAITAWAG